MYLNIKSLLIELLIISAISSAILVIISKNPVISVIFLISLVLNSALFLMVKGMPFLGISYILIYLGAIIVLFLFVIMMINIKLTDILETGYQYTKNIPLALTVSGLFLYEFFNVLPSYLNSPTLPLDSSIFLSIIKEIVLTLNNFFNNIISNSLYSVGAESINASPTAFAVGSDFSVSAFFNSYSNNIIPLMSGHTVASNWPETLISSYTQIVSVAYSLYTYGAFWFLLLSLILLLAMIAPIYLSRK
jgi:NADH-ubiquinone oxidoreductase chain 6